MNILARNSKIVSPVAPPVKAQPPAAFPVQAPTVAAPRAQPQHSPVATRPHAGPSIIGVGHYHYRYPTGREGDGPAAAFSPRSTATVVYLPDGVGAHRDNLEKLGPHTSGVGCLYLKDLSKVDISVLESIIRDSYATLTAGTFGHRARESSDRRPGGERSSEG